MTDLWGKVYAFREEAEARGDRERMWLVDLHDTAYDSRETDPDLMLALFVEGRRLAEKLGEPWFVLSTTTGAPSASFITSVISGMC